MGKKRLEHIVQIGKIDHKALRVNVTTQEMKQKAIQRIDVDESGERIVVFHKNAEKELKVMCDFYQVFVDGKV